MTGSISAETLEIVLLSLAVSGASSLLAALAGIPLGAAVALGDFKRKRLVFALLNTWMALPAVVIGLFVYLFLARGGPLGALGLLYTPGAMIIAQALLATPILAALTASALREKGRDVAETALSLGADRVSAARAVISEARFALVTAALTGFSRVLGETGMTMMVGGNIKGFTRVMTTSIALETMKGNFELGIILGVVLIAMALIVNFGIQFFQGYEQ
jgi:tungstate transport system permease protein